MRPALKKDDPVTYTDPRPGLHSRPEGIFIRCTEDPRIALVQPKYPRGAAPIPVPVRCLKVLVVVERQKRAVAGIRAAVSAGAGAPVIARTGSAGVAQPRPQGKIEDPEYLAWIRCVPCCGCGVSRSQAHHQGPRPIGRKTHDWLTAPLCWTCHRMFHQLRTLPSQPQALLAKVYVLRVELTLLLEYFAGALGTSAQRFSDQGVAAATLPPEERVGHLRETLDMLVMELAQRTGAGRAGQPGAGVSGCLDSVKRNLRF